jgi:hypothetical protein
MTEPLFKVAGRTLTLYRNPELSEMEQVKQALYEMAGEGIAEGDEENGSDGVLDMTALPGASSTTVGMTVAVHLRFAEAGRRLRIRLNPKLLKLFELTMLTDTLSLEMQGKEEAGGKETAKGKKG